MLEILGEADNELCDDVFVSILEASIDLDRMKYVGAQQYLAPSLLNEKSLILAAKVIM